MREGDDDDGDVVVLSVSVVAGGSSVAVSGVDVAVASVVVVVVPVVCRAAVPSGPSMVVAASCAVLCCLSSGSMNRPQLVTAVYSNSHHIYNIYILSVIPEEGTMKGTREEKSSRG